MAARHRRRRRSSRPSPADRPASPAMTATRRRSPPPQQFAPDVPAVFVATGTNFPDALSAAAAAALVGGPLLLTPSDHLPSAVADEIKRLSPSAIYVVGGADAVSITVRFADALSDIAKGLNDPATVDTNYAGGDRYETRSQHRGFGLHEFDARDTRNRQLIPRRSVCDGGCQVPARLQVILVDGIQGTLSPATLRRAHPTRRHHPSASPAVRNTISQGVVDQLQRLGYPVTRYSGGDRYETAAALNRAYFPDGAQTMFLATGTNFPDALSGAALAGRLKSPLFIHPPRLRAEHPSTPPSAR